MRLAYGLLGFLALVAFNFAPTIVAFARKRPDRLPILWLNLALGWTVVGWVIALIWALLRKGATRI
jgi:hypothetical protein